MRLRLKIGKWAKQREILVLGDPTHNRTGMLENLTVGRVKTMENNLLNGKKGSHVTNAGVHLSAHAEELPASVLDVVRRDIKSLTA